MPTNRQIQAWADKVLERPRGQMAVTLYHGKGGLTLRYQGRVFVRCPASERGRMIAPFVAQALGVKLPQVGGSAAATVSSGVLFRVISVASLDLRQEEAHILLDYLMREAAELRSLGSAEV